MSLDINELVRAVKLAAVEAVRADRPMGLCFGTVVTASPLAISIDQKLTLGPAQLILTDNVCDHTVEMTVDHVTEQADSHTHRYQGRKTFTVHKGLSAGEKVVLLRCDGGQQFIVLNRWRG